MPKEYLGDSVYVDSTPFGIILATENGYGASNTIIMEPEVWQALVDYVNRLKEIPEDGV